MPGSPLEKGDLGEYNQCQTQLRALYAQKLGGNPVEFKAYRILYFIHTSNRTALNDVLADLTTAEKEEKAIKHALDVRSALAWATTTDFSDFTSTPPTWAPTLWTCSSSANVWQLCRIFAKRKSVSSQMQRMLLTYV
jgi:hypothetical protein